MPLMSRQMNDYERAFLVSLEGVYPSCHALAELLGIALQHYGVLVELS
jgi:hypothetical protein